MKYKAVLFDLGSTLINYENQPWSQLGLMGCQNAMPLLNEFGIKDISAELLWKEFHEAIDRMFENHTEDLIEIDLGQVTTEILTGLGLNLTDGYVTKFIASYYEPITNQISLIPGAKKLLRQIDSTGSKIGLISNTIFPAEYHRREMERFDILRHFDFTIFSSEIKIRKPKKDIYLKALELSQIAPEETIFIGDRLMEDIAGPQSLGIRGVLKRVEGRDYSAQVKPFGSIKELSELENLLF